MDEERTVCAHCGFAVKQQHEWCPLCEEEVVAIGDR